MVESTRYDRKNKRTITMYVDKDGMQHRHNSVPLDGLIDMHVHYNNPHESHILSGIFDFIFIAPGAVEEVIKEVRKGDKVIVEPGFKHKFVPKPVPEGWLSRWVVDCVYPVGMIL